MEKHVTICFDIKANLMQKNSLRSTYTIVEICSFFAISADWQNPFTPGVLVKVFILKRAGPSVNVQQRCLRWDVDYVVRGGVHIRGAE